MRDLENELMDRKTEIMNVAFEIEDYLKGALSNLKKTVDRDLLNFKKKYEQIHNVGHVTKISCVSIHQEAQRLEELIEEYNRLIDEKRKDRI